MNTDTPTPKRGRPRTRTQPGEPHSNGQRQLQVRMPDDVIDYVRSRPRGWLVELVRKEMQAP